MLISFHKPAYPEVSVNREKKPDGHDLVSIDRRNFLVRCCQGAALLPGLADRAVSSLYLFDPPPALGGTSAFHLQPHYRERLPLEATLAKLAAGSDGFVTEKYHEQLAAILAQWSEDWVESPLNLGALESALTSDFSGGSLLPAESRILRSGPPLEIRVNKFSGENVGRNRFLEHLRAYLKAFSSIITAEFAVTSIAATAKESPSDLRLTTQVRYTLVGSGGDFYRQQRTGYWQLEWQAAPAGDFRLAKWQAFDETQ